MRPPELQEEDKRQIEAALLGTPGPLSVEQLIGLWLDHPEAAPTAQEIRALLTELREDYATRVVELVEVASGYRFQVRSPYALRVARLTQEAPRKYSRAFLETLAIIAYRQPVTRAEIEQIRGVALSAGLIKTLFERDWIKTVGHREVPGRPELLATTRVFLDYFNLRSLDDLPALAELKDLDLIVPALEEQ